MLRFCWSPDGYYIGECPSEWTILLNLPFTEGCIWKDDISVYLNIHYTRVINQRLLESRYHVCA